MHACALLTLHAFVAFSKAFVNSEAVLDFLKDAVSAAPDLPEDEPEPAPKPKRKRSAAVT